MIVQGKIKWAKVLGEPGWGYEKKHREWSLDLFIDEETEHKLEVNGLKKRIKDKDGERCITFKRKEFKADGKENAPIRIVDDHGELWDPSKKIGNGSVVNVNFALNEYKPGEVNANILSMQVWDHIPFGDEFETRINEDTKADWKADAE